VPAPPRRIAIVGVTGSGKSTLAALVSEATGIPWTSMDALIWEPGWRLVPAEERVRRWTALAEGECWILDALPGTGMGVLLPRAELVVALDYPRRVSLGRLLTRTVRRILSRESICNGNTESLRLALSRDSIIVWHFRSFAEKRERIAALVADPAGPRVVRLTSQRATDAWLEDLRRSLS
jgi:adenylate kinase family enzyme